jgi:DNA-binding NarL/FixJ family response regulator
MPVFVSAPDRKRTIIRTPSEVIQIFLGILHGDGTPLERMRRRDEEIYRMFAEGVPKMEIARRFGISARRVGQIINKITF